MEQVHNLSGIETASDIDCINNSTGLEWVNIIYDLNTPIVELPASTSAEAILTSTDVITPSAAIFPTSSSSGEGVVPATNTPEASSSPRELFYTHPIPTTSDTVIP